MGGRFRTIGAMHRAFVIAKHDSDIRTVVDAIAIVTHGPTTRLSDVLVGVSGNVDTIGKPVIGRTVAVDAQGQ